MYDFWKEWFNQPDSEKRKYLREHGKGGWYPPDSESPGFSGTADKKEYFHFRSNHDLDYPTSKVFASAWKKCADYITMRGYPELVFHPDHSVLRIIRYFDTGEGIFGEPHYDFDFLTLAFPGTRPGLQVHIAGDWRDMEPVQPRILHGEMLSIYTANKKMPVQLIEKADYHRVYSKEPGERYVAVFFYHPPSDFELKPGYTAADYFRDVTSKSGAYK